MPNVNAYIDRKIYNEVMKLIATGKIDNIATAVQVGLMLLVKVVKKCEEKRMELGECIEKVIEEILA